MTPFYVNNAVEGLTGIDTTLWDSPIDATLTLVPVVEVLPLQIATLIGGIFLNGVATGAYIGAGMGPGPRDGLTTSLAARTRRSLRLVRLVVELSVVVLGVALGGQLGVGTVVFALAIGPLMHFFVPRLDVSGRHS